MRIPESEIQPYEEQIVGFSSERVDTRRYIDLYTTFGEEGGLEKTIKIRYLFVNVNTSYKILLDRSSINHLKAIVSTPHLAMKFPSTEEDIVTVHVDQKVAPECYVTSLKVESTRRIYKASPRSRSRERRERPTENSSPSEAREYIVALVDLDPWLDDAQMEAGEDLQPFPHIHQFVLEPG